MAPKPQTVAKAIQHFLPSKLPPTLSNSPSSLYQVLSRFPQDGVGQKVYQTRWGVKGFPGCYWEVTRTKLKLEGKHGKAWGHLVWRGKRVHKDETMINGGLKYTWATGTSTSGIVPPKTPSTSA
ncbi:hypothetical protein BDM02DRAFT_3098726 [Thelephora ganbajun]|uniref:Uncharacterized protein n=1 Tax=Thelephora ganbajun TaxID=370292 RepID=A0ACB6ZBM7_THEGA|nr:hypothetical protein BDM02DRAFT_3098726 [Thelephora ganbajun]